MSEAPEARGRGADRGNEGLSWFGPSDAEALGDEPDTAAEAQPGATDSQGTDPPFFFHQARRLVDSGGSAFQRLYRAFLAARAALGLALLATQAAAHLLGGTGADWTLPLCGVYALLALALWLAPQSRRHASPQAMARLRSPQWWASIGMDLALFGALHALDSGTGVSYGALFVMPVLMAGVLTPRLLALATAAMAALMVLGVALWAVLHGADPGLRLSQAGMVGVGFFVVGLLASELASRLAREERAARGSMALARQQAQLNRLVIDEMQEGVLVVDRRGHVRAANPAARSLLGEQDRVRTAPFQLRGVPAWAPLVAAVEQAFAQGRWPEEGSDVPLMFKEAQRLLSVRMRFTRRRESPQSEELCVLFIEDVRNVQARSRQEKLAAMGRVSAGIAHEIRNPLAAIDQANALLAEDAVDAHARQLTTMVANNVQRLKRIVEDVMEVAPGVAPQVMPVDASALVAETCRDWARTNGLTPWLDGPLAIELPEQSLVVAFEPEHLRRVLVNLLDNALRHASPGAAGIQLRLAPAAAAWATLSVFSAGEALPPEVESHLFEPFFSTRSRGSGLGLYICRELCERYGGRIDYQRQQHGGVGGNAFVLSLRRLPEPAPSP